MADAERWQALKDYLTQRIEYDLAAHEDATAAGDTYSAASYGGRTGANRATLDKMRELEASQ
jgi:hypothetical protein